MKQLIVISTFLLLMLGISSCSKCYVCKDKTSTTFTKYEFCDKDFDKGDINAAIANAEAGGATCHAKSRAF